VHLVVKDHLVRYVGPHVTPTERVDGWCDPAFAAVGNAFRENFADGLETGAALSVSVSGRPVVDLWGGWAEPEVPWDRDTVVCVFSCSKGLLALAALRLVEEGRLDLDAPVSRYWPDFGSGAKQSVLVRHLLTHEAGLPAVTRQLPFGSLRDWEVMTGALAETDPWWEPGTAHGYHGVTFGYLLGEVLRRITGSLPTELFRSTLADRLGVDLDLRATPRQQGRIAELFLAPSPDGTFFEHWEPDDLGPKSFFNPPDCSDISYTNTPAFRESEIPGANGFGTARALDRAYSIMACGGQRDGDRIVSNALVTEAGKMHVSGIDRVMKLPTAFGLGFEHTIPEWKFGPSPNAYGHNGSGGSLGLVDPDCGLSLGYVMNRLHWGKTRDDPRWHRLFDTLYNAL
jgi:CubicO group peptidase (beta-lactamase class C family)